MYDENYLLNNAVNNNISDAMFDVIRFNAMEKRRFFEYNVVSDSFKPVAR
jgi:hypothetical protein